MKHRSNVTQHQRAEENPQQKQHQHQHPVPLEGERHKEFPSSETSNISGDTQEDMPLSERIREAQKIQEPVQKKVEESEKSKAEQHPIGGRQGPITNQNYGVGESETPIQLAGDNENKKSTSGQYDEGFIGGQENTGNVGIKEGDKVTQQESNVEPWSESQKQQWEKPKSKQEQDQNQDQEFQSQSQSQSQSQFNQPTTNESEQNVQWKPTSNEPTSNEPTSVESTSSNIGQFKKDETEFDSSSNQRSQEKTPSGFNQMKNEIDYGEESYKGINRLMGRKVLISGDEFGRGVVISFIREGADVCFNYLPNRQNDADSLLQVLDKEIKENNRKLEFIPGDLKNESFCKELVNEAQKKLGGLDCLVLTAGRQREFQDITELSLDSFRETFEVNLFSMFNIVKAAIPHLSKGSTIITTSSIEAFKPSTNLLDYSCSKAAVVSFTLSLAKQLASKGIRVNSIAPGNIVTSRHPSIKVENSDFKRCGQPFEMSSLFVYLASNESSYCTGSIYPLCGGNMF